MPWRFITRDIDVEVKYKKAPNKLLIPDPQIELESLEGKPVTVKRVVTDKKFVWIGKGVDLVCEAKFIDPEDGKEVSSAEVLEVLDHYRSKKLDAEANEVRNDEIIHFAVTPDGREGVKPFKPSDTIDLTDEDNWVPSTAI